MVLYTTPPEGHAAVPGANARAAGARAAGWSTRWAARGDVQRMAMFAAHVRAYVCSKRI